MLNIIWSDDAIQDVLDNIDYLERQWTEKDIEKFSNKMDAVLNKLSKGNLRFKPSGYKNIFEVPIVKQMTLYYKIQDNTIYLVRFWNNHKNPEALNIPK